MPVIPEEMDNFVDWSNAAPPVGAAFDIGTQPQADFSSDFDLALENVEGDDFSFMAIQHYDSSNMPSLDPALATLDNPESLEFAGWEIPDAPCHHCQAGGYLCKRIREGEYKGYCTSCVALRCECSFGPATGGSAEFATFPPNPWPTLGDHPDAIPQEDIFAAEKIQSSSASDLPGLNALSDARQTGAGGIMPKIGARFSRESVKILKNWLSTHSRHPYPTEEEKETLQRQTGLNKTQITNWLANARRRGKIQQPRSTSPHVKSWGKGIDIPARRGTPSLESMNPLQRWQNSPPEHEPASVTAIARAVHASSSTLSSGLNSPYSFNLTDDGSNVSLFNQSSASSLGTSRSKGSSGGSFASAFSHGSRGSLGSFNSFSRGRRRRRRRATPKRPEEGPTPLSAPLKTFQCTFCTETFRTKHDWQRHEKSLHLSLERWVCTPDGPKALNPENGKVCCVFCGQADPDDAHIEAHNHSACQERNLEERTFYRKDHLRQHLKLVHNVKFITWSMEPWKVATPEIRSRCGFCGIVMDTWTIRVDHLAEHFKTGKSMADWKGDWGFEPPVLNMVENSIPPYLIHDERNSPLPYTATSAPPESPRNAYELIKTELVYWMVNRKELTGNMPTDDETQFEACRIIFGSEVLSKHGLSSRASWLRDLIMSNEHIANKAKLGPIRGPADSRMAQLKINGRDNLFEDCPMELALAEFVKAKSLLGLTAMPAELQVEACNILGRQEESSGSPSDEVANFLVRLIYRNPNWLQNFSQRAALPRFEDLENLDKRSKDPNTVDSTIHSYSRLESELAEYVKTQRAMGVEPTDENLQKRARIIIYEFDDGWNQTAADNSEWLAAFKQRHFGSPKSTSTTLSVHSSESPFKLDSITPASRPSAAAWLASSADLAAALQTSSDVGAQGDSPGNGSSVSNPVKTGPFFLNDANCYRRLARELTRYVASTMSPNNPNFHIPSDEELQHQARWILYDDDDPWNQTAADNAEWLRRFKRDVGILNDDEGPGLPPGNQWNIQQGGTGFAPPYVFPNPHAHITPFNDERVSITLRDGSKPFETESATANKYLHSLSTRLDPPASIFCSRELENELVSFVQGHALASNGQLPSDAALRGKAREILRTEQTAADDAVLLQKFKAMMQQRLGGEEASTAEPTTLGEALPPLPPELKLSDSELNDILQDMNFELGDAMDLSGSA